MTIEENLHQTPPRFDPGRVLMTPGAQYALLAAKQSPTEFIVRHITGDWGDVDRGDARENERSIKPGWRILSSYATKAGEKLWVITDAIDLDAPGADPRKRQTTTILLPEEY